MTIHEKEIPPYIKILRPQREIKTNETTLINSTNKTYIIQYWINKNDTRECISIEGELK